MAYGGCCVSRTPLVTCVCCDSSLFSCVVYLCHLQEGLWSVTGTTKRHCDSGSESPRQVSPAAGQADT